MPQTTDTILIFTDTHQAQEKPVYRGAGEIAAHVSSKSVEVTVETMQKKMNKFLTSLGQIIKESPVNIGGFSIDTVEIHAQVDGKGNLGILGLGGIELGLQSGIKFVLRRNNSTMSTAEQNESHS